MCLHKLCGDAQLLVDLFVNFDCDLDSSNLFERLVNSLVRVAQGLPGVADLTGAEAAREAVLKAEALECLSGMLEALGGWVDDMLGTNEAKTAAVAAAAAAAKAARDAAAGDGGGGGGGGGGRSGGVGSSGGLADVAADPNGTFNPNGTPIAGRAWRNYANPRVV